MFSSMYIIINGYISNLNLNYTLFHILFKRLRDYSYTRDKNVFLF